MISTRGRYALRVMIDLAQNDHGEPVRIKEIAARQNISVKYLEQIIAALAKGGLVRSVRGPQGGYHLAADPEKCTAGDIIRLTEGDMAPVACLGGSYSCPKTETCTTIRFWKELDDAINDVMDRYTLADLCGGAAHPSDS